MNPLMDFIPVWQCDRKRSKILCVTIPNPVHDLKVKVTDLEVLAGLYDVQGELL